MVLSCYLKKIVGATILAILLSSVPRSLADTINFQDPLVIDTFYDKNRNDVDAWHGGEEGMTLEYGPGYVRLIPTAIDMGYHTKVSQYCGDLTLYKDMFLHISFAGTDEFTVSLNQDNDECSLSNWSPVTRDSVQASRYNYMGEDLYIPISHFYIDLERVSSIQFNGFYTLQPVELFLVEITSDVPPDFDIPFKLPSGTLFTQCTRPNSFAFGIDDGNPEFAQQIMDILEDEGILVTFFTVGNSLVDPTANFTEIYKQMLRRGHQVAMHTYSHPALEGLQSLDEIHYQIEENIRVLEDNLGIYSQYFRPPYGIVGARTRQELADIIEDPYIINWSVDVEDWLWADTDTPEKQLRAFRRDLKKGGNLAVMHYAHHTTVGYFREFIKMVKESGKQIMRVDQCLEDPNAPSLYSY
ncbi:hypothetical protein VTO42DRAFT_6045 [Malbranchea cinnamomea]